MLFHITNFTLADTSNINNIDTFPLTMCRAALKQLLRDNSDKMDQEQIDQILDQIQLLTLIIDEMEKNE